MNFTTLTIERGTGSSPDPRQAWVWMNRAQLHNAFDETLIAELTQAFQWLDADPGVRLIVLAGQGKSFSAGADLNMMRRLGAASLEQNRTDGALLAELYRVIATCRKPTLARVHGAAIGGGLGLVAACDISVASTQAQFATSEVRLGIVPATIGPYVVRAIGQRQAYRYFQSAERIDAVRAREIGLVHEAVAPEALDATIERIAQALLAGGPEAQAASTDLIRAVADTPITPELIADTAERIARIRATPEAQEGLTAFLDKRPPHWVAS